MDMLFIHMHQGAALILSINRTEPVYKVYAYLFRKGASLCNRLLFFTHWQFLFFDSFMYRIIVVA